VISPMLALQIAGFATKIGAVALEESNPQVAKNLKLLSKIVDVGTQTAGQITKAGASPNIGDVTKKDPLSFNEGLKINKDGGISGIDYEKFNFDKGMKAFSTDFKNSGTIFDSFKSNTEQLGISGGNYDDYGKIPNYFNR